MKNPALIISLLPMLWGAVSAQENRGGDIESLLQQYSAYYLDSVSKQAPIFSGKIQQPIENITESLYLRERGKKVFDIWGKEAYPQPIPVQESYTPGTLFYDGTFYTGVSMRLDLCRDELVLLAPNKLNGIILDPSRVGYADLQGYRTIYIYAGDPAYNLPEGYYQILYDKTRQVLKKETFLYSINKNTFVNRSILYYIEKDGAYHSVSSKKGPVLRFFKEYRRELDQYIRQNRIDFKDAPERALERVVAEYDRLNDQTPAP